ncbi:MAG: AI-2E family transporter [Firmicutes bacterium]|nr:AI-2E family transporter [Bacillota bacterium]
MFEGKFFKFGLSILLILLILFLWKQVHYIYEPLNSVLALLMTPLLISFFFYYLLRPLVRFLAKYLRKKSLAILIIFLLIAVVIISISYFGGSLIQKQVKDLTNLFSNYYASIRNSLRNADNELLLHYIEKYNIEEKLSSFVARLFTTIQNNFFGFFSKVTNSGPIIILIPVILYYFLRDDRAIYHGFIGLLPAKIRKMGSSFLAEADRTLAHYITGQLIVALIEGCLALIGYLIIGLPNALILALIITVTAFIPFIGAILGALPAVLIGITSSFSQAIKVVIVLIVVNQLENNLIAPRLHGSRLQIHPLIVILVVMAFVTVFGFLGALFAVPTYVVARVLFREIRKFKETQEANEWHHS